MHKLRGFNIKFATLLINKKSLVSPTKDVALKQDFFYSVFSFPTRIDLSSLFARNAT